MVAEESVIDAIADFICWIRVHGGDADDVLDRAQMRVDPQEELGREVHV